MPDNTLATEVARLGEAVKNLEDWQKRQNGTVSKLASDFSAYKDAQANKSNATLFAVLMTLVGVVIQLLRG